jgi:chromosome segregation ATPase
MTIKFDVHVHLASVDDLRSIQTSLAHLLTLGERHMSAISDFAAKQSAFNARIDSAVDGLTQDIAEMNAKIQELQNTPGAITPEDQGLLDELQQRGEGMAQKLEALDALHPPAPPVVP